MFEENTFQMKKEFMLQTITIRAPSHHNILGAVKGPELPLLGQVSILILIHVRDVCCNQNGCPPSPLGTFQKTNHPFWWGLVSLWYGADGNPDSDAFVGADTDLFQFCKICSGGF